MIARRLAEAFAMAALWTGAVYTFAFLLWSVA